MKKYIKKNKNKVVLISVILFPITLPLMILGGVGFIIWTILDAVHDMYSEIIDHFIA